MNEMNMMYRKLSKNTLRRLAVFVLALCMVLPLFPVPPANAAFSDAAMDKLLNWGVINGYPDGALHPDWSLTRAEFVAMVNRAYGYDELGVTPFIDVPDNSWFRDDINIGYTANYFTGVSPRMAGPDQKLTREQAMVLLARNMRMQPADGETIDFTDGRDFSDWSRGYAHAAKDAGVIGGYGDGSYKPKNNITRGEMAVMLQRALGTLINTPGTHTLSDVYGNVTISSPNVILKDSTIAGDLYITGGLSLGDVTLQNVRVLGKIVIAGGGESQSGESVILRNVQADALIVDSIANQYVSIASEGDTAIGEAVLRTSAYVQDRTRPGDGLLHITLDSLDPAAVFTLSGNLESIVNKTPGSVLNIAMGTAASVTIDEVARGSLLHLDINSTVEELNLDTGVTVEGVGDIGDLFVNAPGASVEMLPDRVTIRPGLTADIAGQTMNAQQAQESSADPRLLAGYPKVRNIAPTNANSVYSANKGGTVYWAVSNTTDGSIGEEELISPTDDNTRIELSGTTTIEQSNTEHITALEKLIPDSNYYLSTVMVDARGRRSPVKVASFATPDNTVPAFAQGYPTVMKNYCVSLPFRDDDGKLIAGAIQRDEDGYPIRNYRVQVAAMPNKTCMLYYAVYPAGSTAPTAQQFRTGALGGPIRSGVEDASKNRINYIELTGLDELTDYDIYLCYIDADGSRSSAVQKLTFKTVDGKPPRFQHETPTVTQEQLTSLRLSVNVNENATVYWVATKDPLYIKDKDSWDQTLWWENACRQIESGSGGIRSGSVNARANVDTTINITGLEAATRYYIYFVAKDAAGNYSEFFIDTEKNPGLTPGRFPNHPEQYTPSNQEPYKYRIPANTLDNIPPTAWQEFTSYDAADETRPYADTDILIHFSESVMQYSANRGATTDEYMDFYTLYDKLVKARATYDKVLADNGGSLSAKPVQDAKADLTLAENNFVRTLRATIKLYNNAETTNQPVPDRSDTDNWDGENWVIDYRWAEVDYDFDTGEMTVRFPTVMGGPDDPDNSRSALNLASGATYHFVLEDICDTSKNMNRIADYVTGRPVTRTNLPDFTTISAQVRLNTTTGVSAQTVTYHNPKTGNDEIIPLDMKFSLTPLSTSVEDYVDWDLIFWSDTPVEFEVYELEDSDGNNPVLTHPLNDANTTYNNPANPTTYGHHSVRLPVSTNETPDSDTGADNYLGYQGVSYFREFYGVGTNDANGKVEFASFPSVTGKGHLLDSSKAADEGVNPSGVMERMVPKYYGIHITSLNYVGEEGRGKTWNATVKFRLSVLTSSSDNLSNFAIRLIDNKAITDFDGDPIFGGSIIHTPRPAPMRKEFSSSLAPELLEGEPRFEVHDTYAKMTLAIDRDEGRVHYVIAKASEWNTSHTKRDSRLLISTTAYDPKLDNGTPFLFHDSETEHPGYYERYNATYDGNVHADVPTSGGDLTVPYFNADTGDFELTAAKTAKFEVILPSSDVIYGHRGIMGVSGIQFGSQDVNMVSQEFMIEGLDPETIYLVYIVTQDQANNYSPRPRVFQFETTVVERPSLRFAPGSSRDSATVTADRAATVQAVVFPTGQLAGLTPLDTPFKDAVNTADSAWLALVTANSDYTKDGFTVLDALLTPYDNRPPATDNGYGSLFDRFARTEIKDQVRDLIRMNSSGTTGGLGSQLQEKDINSKGEFVNFSFKEFLDGTLEYTLLAMAFSPGLGDEAGGDSRGFGAWQPIQLVNNNPPYIVEVGDGSPNLSISYENDTNGRLSGSFDITFSAPLYICPDNKTYTPITATNVGTEFFNTNQSTFKATAGTRYPDANGAINIVNVAFEDLPLSGGSFTVNMYISQNNGYPRVTEDGDPMVLSIAVSYDTAKGVFRFRVINNGDLWFPDAPDGVGTWEWPLRPVATSFGFSTNMISVDENGTAELTVNFLPVGARGTVYLSVDNSNISLSNTVVTDASPTIIVTGLTAGTSKITGSFSTTPGSSDPFVNVTVNASAKKRYLSFEQSYKEPNATVTIPVNGPSSRAQNFTLYVYGATASKTITATYFNNSHYSGVEIVEARIGAAQEIRENGAVVGYRYDCSVNLTNSCLSSIADGKTVLTNITQVEIRFSVPNDADFTYDPVNLVVNFSVT